MAADADWAPQNLHTHNPSITSIHSFAFSSSSTLASPPSSPCSSTYKEHNLLIQEHEISESLHHTHQRRHWRKTPLTIRGLTGLLFRLILALLLPLIPSFLRRGNTLRKLHPTSYLDGLRGIAALFVFINHFTISWFENLKFGYGSSDTNYSLLQLPIVRLLYSGRASVGVFFVISGYVLSSKPLSLIHTHNTAELASVLSSAVLRRGMRLYIPTIVGTFISMLIAANGYYLNTPAQTATLPLTFETWGEHVWHWVGCTMELVYPFREADLEKLFSPDYNGHLWTIPVEFFGSIVVFITVLGLSGARTKVRLGIVAGLAVWALQWGRWDIFLFLGGVFLAGINLISTSNDLSSELPFSSSGEEERSRSGMSISSPAPGILLAFEKLKPKLNIAFLFLSLYLLSFTGDTPPLAPTFSLNPDTLITPISDLTSLPTTPDGFTDPEPYIPPPPNHGFYYQSLPNLIPTSYTTLWNGPEFYILSLGAILLIFSLSNSRTLQRSFNTEFAQYLGDVSYSLYIVHGMVVFSLGSHLQGRWTDAYPPAPVFYPEGEIGSSGSEGGTGGVRDVLGWGIQGSYGEGIVFNRDVLGVIGGVEGMAGEGDTWRYGKAFFAATVLNGVVAFWVADLFWRGVDRRCVRLARGVEGWVCRR